MGAARRPKKTARTTARRVLIRLEMRMVAAATGKP